MLIFSFAGGKTEVITLVGCANNAEAKTVVPVVRAGAVPVGNSAASRVVAPAAADAARPGADAAVVDMHPLAGLVLAQRAAVGARDERVVAALDVAVRNVHVA